MPRPSHLCPACGAPYVPAQECTPGCWHIKKRERMRLAARDRDAFYKQQRQAKREGREPVQRVCAYCGDSFMPSYHRRVYCSDRCAKQPTLEQVKASTGRFTPPKQVEIDDSRSHLDHIVRQEEGLSLRPGGWTHLAGGGWMRARHKPQ
jgi:hypothetical protein